MYQDTLNSGSLESLVTEEGLSEDEVVTFFNTLPSVYRVYDHKAFLKLDM